MRIQVVGWTERPTEEFVRAVLEATAEDGWVVDGNDVGRLGDVLRPDLVVWLDYPRRVTFPRVLRRTLRRVVTRQELWNGNHERWRAVLSRDPATSILRWSWTQHHVYRELLGSRADERWVRLTSPRQAEAWLRR